MSGLLNGLRAVLVSVLQLLPGSPFRGFIDSIAEIPLSRLPELFYPGIRFPCPPGCLGGGRRCVLRVKRNPPVCKGD